MAFGAKDRIPVRPLDINESNGGELALRKEMMVNYKTGEVFVKDEDGVVHNIYSSESTKSVINQSIKEDPTLITNAKLYDQTEDGKDKDYTVKEAVSNIDSRVKTLEDIDHNEYFNRTKNNTVSGDTTFDGIIILKEGVNFGDTAPAEGNVDGRLFFLLLNEV